MGTSIYSEAEARQAIASASTWKDVLDALGYSYFGKNIKTLGSGLPNGESLLIICRKVGRVRRLATTANKPLRPLADRAHGLRRCDVLATAIQARMHARCSSAPLDGESHQRTSIRTQPAATPSSEKRHH